MFIINKKAVDIDCFFVWGDQRGAIWLHSIFIGKDYDTKTGSSYRIRSFHISISLFAISGEEEP